MSENIGSKIQKLREDKGLSQEQVARMAGLSVGYLSKLEQGAETHQNPTLKTLKSIAKILEVYFFEPLEKEISVEDMQRIVDANEKLVKELKTDGCIKFI